MRTALLSLRDTQHWVTVLEDTVGCEASKQTRNGERAAATACRGIRLLIVEDEPIVREGLAAVLGAQSDMEVAGATANALEAVAFLRQREVDIVLTDIRTPGTSGLELLGWMREEKIPARAIVLTGLESDAKVGAAFELGAWGVLRKALPCEEIFVAIRQVHEANRFVSRDAGERLAGRKASVPLSTREVEVLALVAKGLTNKEIGTALHVSAFTVRNHLHSVTRKLEVSDRTEAAFAAVSAGILAIP